MALSYSGSRKPDRQVFAAESVGISRRGLAPQPPLAAFSTGKRHLLTRIGAFESGSPVDVPLPAPYNVEVHRIEYLAAYVVDFEQVTKIQGGGLAERCRTAQINASKVAQRTLRRSIVRYKSHAGG
jgi:hypothetical protein